jgi:hypothetical protein
VSALVSDAGVRVWVSGTRRWLGAVLRRGCQARGGVRGAAGVMSEMRGYQARGSGGARVSDAVSGRGVRRVGVRHAVGAVLRRGCQAWVSDAGVRRGCQTRVSGGGVSGAVSGTGVGWRC